MFYIFVSSYCLESSVLLRILDICIYSLGKLYDNMSFCIYLYHPSTNVKTRFLSWTNLGVLDEYQVHYRILKFYENMLASVNVIIKERRKYQMDIQTNKSKIIYVYLLLNDHTGI